MRELYKRVLLGMQTTRPSDFECLAGLTEEVGEWSLALRVERGLKKRTLDEPSKNEAVDIILLAEELPRIVDQKMSKWESTFEG